MAKMIAVVLFAFLAVAQCAPHGYYHNHGRHFRPYHSGRYESDSPYGAEFFDTNRFWNDLETQVRQEVEEALKIFTEHFPNSVSTAGFVGNEYKVTIPMAGYSEKDIIVKAREGSLMVQAAQKVSEGFMSNYIEVRTLPLNVNADGVWTYNNNVLTITFSVKADATTEAVTETTLEPLEIVTRGLGSREEMDTKDSNIDLYQNKEIETNEISSTVEATTYPVDLKNEVEFVPIKY